MKDFHYVPDGPSIESGIPLQRTEQTREVYVESRVRRMGESQEHEVTEVLDMAVLALNTDGPLRATYSNAARVMAKSLRDSILECIGVCRVLESSDYPDIADAAFKRGPELVMFLAAIDPVIVDDDVPDMAPVLTEDVLVLKAPRKRRFWHRRTKAA